ncbi:TetR/AcrR family transcriptional regulator [Olivibacter sp. SDN3]|uniref:TetR/AcrR family transcriptional regulator n=1 Tax=Olivibacter sp. SDN3 TaxID=2764720 RepID=UPI0016518EA3|nr:TetR family transcriptional regulator [Olivibacter sp. SDN3]QNL51462.1 TetR/AcrR family transcriptional regulator [Olivibacter sp. SDN3]
MKTYSDKQLQIMDIALRLFADHGYDKTSVRDIAQEAGVNVAMVSYYFGSKDKLLEALFINHFAFITSTLENILHEKTSSAFEKVEKIIDVFIDTLYSRQLFNQLMMREASILKEGPLFEMILEMKTKNRKLVERAVKSGQRLGVFRKDVNVFFLSSVLIGSVNQMLANCRYEARSNKLEGAAKDNFKKEGLSILRVHLKRMFIAYLTFDESHK